jgi:pyrroline-5-carboxylate reductase
LIGFGNMGRALARGWLAHGHDPAATAIVDQSAAAIAAARELELRAQPAIDPGFRPDVVVLAVKPNQMSDALAQCRAAQWTAPVFLSIAAGKTLAQLAQGLRDGAAVVRAMPNTPAAIGRGASVLVANGAATAEQRGWCEGLLAAVGSTAWIDDERAMDAVTAVSGSGPAYVFLLIECLERAAQDAGLEPELAKQLALTTVAGAGAYAAAAPEAPAELRRRVTSPGGTTEAALRVLQGEHGLDELLTRAVRAATARSRELSQI